MKAELRAEELVSAAYKRAGKQQLQITWLDNFGKLEDGGVAWNFNILLLLTKPGT